MASELETSILNILCLREYAVAKFPEEVMQKIECVRSKCLLVEKQEGNTSIQWRRGAPILKDRGYGQGQSHGNGQGQGQGPSKHWHTNRSDSSKSKSESNVQNQGRYVSKFKNNDSPVDDKILNEIILNKLNKFSVANYEEIKVFLQQILDSNDTALLQSFMLLVFKKAATEPTFCFLYAKMISELSVQYKTLHEELERLYNDYLTIFEEVSEEKAASYEVFVQRNREKTHRLGYSQFLAELTSLGVLEQEQLEKLYITLLKQIHIHSINDDSKQQLVDEYIDCLLRMTKAFQNKKSSKLMQISQGLTKICEEPMLNILANRTSQFPGISKKSSFAIMDCLDIFKNTSSVA